MNEISKNPVHRNEEFICQNCRKPNTKAAKTCRNHCSNCLFSKHVDDVTPGDRLSDCLGLMKPLHIEFNSKKGYQILHQCMHCNKEMLNKSADDDKIETIIAVMQQQNKKNPFAKKHHG